MWIAFLVFVALLTVVSVIIFRSNRVLDFMTSLDRRWRPECTATIER